MPQTGTAGGRWNPTMRGRMVWRAHKIASSYRSVGIVTVVLTLAHAGFLARYGHAGEVVSGYGASLVVLGVWVAGFPLIRRGLQQVGPLGPSYIDGVLPEFRSFAKRIMDEQERHKIRRDQIDERVVGVAIALVGTLLNGYGTPLARLIGWEH